MTILAGHWISSYFFLSFWIRTPLVFVLGFLLQVPSVFSLECSPGHPAFVRRPFVWLNSESLSSEFIIQVHESPPSACFGLCAVDKNCSAYFVDYRNQSCLLVKEDFDLSLIESKLVKDTVGSYHRKICLPADKICNHEWIFDEIPGVQLYHYLDKTIRDVTTSDSCMSLCLSESIFNCRSARFDASESLCVLSQHDRRTAAEVFHQAPKHDSVLYLERQCGVEEPQGCHFRSRQARAIQKYHRHVQVVSNVTSREACEMACLHFAPFSCRSYQFGGAPAVCLLSPEDSSSEVGIAVAPVKVHEPAEEFPGSTYFEKESCIEVEVKCGANSMDAVVRVATPFRGRVYAAGHPYDCFSVSVSEDGYVTLPLPLHGRQCGTKNLGNGTFINSVVVQHHPNVLRTSDRRIDVACDYEEMKLKVRGAKGIKQGELKPLAHTVTAIAPTPPIRLRVVNASDQDVTGVELGDPLFLKVELADESVYGIFGSDLVARSSGGSETVLLIDDNGCPVEPSVIQALDRLPGSKSLVAPFQAFKFASDSAVKFQMTVSYCLDTCPPAECNSPRAAHTRSYGKKRRKRSTSQFMNLLPGDVVIDVTMESPLFLVTNLKSSAENEIPQPGARWDQQQFQSKDKNEGHIRIKAKANGLCVSMSTLYIIGAIVVMVQIVIVSVCGFFFFYKGSEDAIEKNLGSARSWPSISSRSKLVCSHS